MTSVITELVLVTLAAMLSPTTLSFTVLALVVGERPRRTGFWFYAGALCATLAVGIVAALVIGDSAASSKPNTPKTWVAVIDVVAAVLILIYVARLMRRPADATRAEQMIAQMSKIASSPVIAIVAAGATLANPGGFIPLALKDISELNLSPGQAAIAWTGFALLSLLPLSIALLMLTFAPDRTQLTLNRSRGWLERHARTVAAVIVVLLAVALLRNGIAGLTN